MSKKSKEKENTIKETDQQIEELFKHSNIPFYKLSPNTSKVVDLWKEYKEVEQIMENYQNTNLYELKNNADELLRATNSMIDSIGVTEFNTPSFKIRLNVFQSEVMRLYDMTEIPSLTTEEYIEELKKVQEAFNAIRSKMDNIYQIRNLEKEITINNKNFGNLTTFPLDSITKNQKKEKKQEGITPKERKRLKNYSLKREKALKPFINSDVEDQNEQGHNQND